MKEALKEHFLYLVAVAEVSKGVVEYLVLNNIVQYVVEDMKGRNDNDCWCHRADNLQQDEEWRILPKLGNP